MNSAILMNRYLDFKAALCRKTYTPSILLTSFVFFFVKLHHFLPAASALSSPIQTNADVAGFINVL